MSVANAASDKRAVDALTVAWMLTMLATLMAELCAYAGWIFFAVVSNSQAWPNEFLALPGLMQFAALVTGILCLILAGIVYRIRPIPPPPAVVVTAVVISLLPIATMIFRALW